MFHFKDIPENGIYKLYMHIQVSNDRLVYVLNAIRSKLKLDKKKYTWDCLLGHINKKVITKFHVEGISDDLAHIYLIFKYIVCMGR